MSAPVFLTQEQVTALHQHSIRLFGGAEGIRDTALFAGAVAHPQQVHFYAQSDLFDIAAAYAFHIAQAQACFDGNKRTAVAAALVFLDINGISTDFDSMPLYDAMIAVAQGTIGKAELAAVFRELAK